MNKHDWTITTHERPKLKDATLIEGLPGIGNVGKVVVDFLIEKSGAKLITSFFSYSLPNSVFVNEDNLVELPKIEVYHANIDGKDYLFMTGDVQPTEEMASFTFCEEALKQAKESWDVKHIITLGGIGLQEEPEEPSVYCTGNDKDYIKTFIDKDAKGDVYGLVGPIIGVSGLLLGLAAKKSIAAVALLAETFGHPMHLGLRAAKSTLKLLMNTQGFDYELEDLEEELREQESPSEESSTKQHAKLDTINKLKRFKDTNYIG